MRKDDSRSRLGRRSAVGLITAGLAAPFIRPSLAQQAWPEQTTIPDILKGSGEVRVAGYGGSMQEAQMKGYYESFENSPASRSDPSRTPTRPRSRPWSIPATSNGTWRSSAAARS